MIHMNVWCGVVFVKPEDPIFLVSMYFWKSLSFTLRDGSYKSFPLGHNVFRILLKLTCLTGISMQHAKTLNISAPVIF